MHVSSSFGSIRQLSAAAEVGRVALGEADSRVSIWDLDPIRVVATFETILDFGGQRIRLSNDGAIVLCAAYHRDGVAAYDCATGRLLWQNRGVKRPQRLTTSRTSRLTYVGVEGGPCLALSLDDGSVVERIRGVGRVVESPFDRLVFLDRYHPVVATLERKPLFAVPRTTFAFLGVAFGPRQLVLSEAVGPVRCVELGSGRVAWVHRPPEGVHCVDLAYCGRAEAFVGVLRLIAHGDSRQLVRFNDDGSVVVMKDLGRPAAQCFGQAGASLLTTEGRLIEIPSGNESALGDAPA